MLKATLTAQSRPSLQAKFDQYFARNVYRRVLGRVLWCALFAAAQCSAATRYFDTELSYVHEHNLAHASNMSEALEDDVVLARASANWLQPLESRSGLLASLAGEYQRYTHWQALSRALLSGQLVYRHKPSFAFNAPWFEAIVSGVLRQFDDSAMR